MTDAVITVLLTSYVDPQRGVKWPADVGLLAELLDSLARHDVPAVVLHDELDAPHRDGVTFVEVPAGGNPYFHRWRVIADYLATADHGRVWCVDGTDVEMLHNPFPEMGDGVYCGSEPHQVGCQWMRSVHPGSLNWIRRHAGLPLVNAGILGGPAATVQRIAAAIFDLHHPDDGTDMAAFNRTVHEWPEVVDTGPRVHSVFKAFDRSAAAWWRHK